MMMDTPAPQRRQNDQGIQDIDRDIEAALSRHQRGTQTPREAELESLLWRALTCITVLKKANIEVGQLRQQIKWRDQLDAVPATVMSQNQKAALKVTLQDIQHKTPGTDGLVQIESWHLCKRAGMSKQTFLDHLAYCSELGILRKRTEQVRDPNSQQIIATDYFVGTTELTAHPYKYLAPQPRNHGGARPCCKNPSCRSERLQKRVIKRVIITCLDCGEVQSDETSDQTDMLSDHLDRQFDHAAASPVVESTLEHHDENHTPGRNVNLTTYKTNVLEGQVDIPAPPQQEPATPPVGDGGSGAGFPTTCRANDAPAEDVGDTDIQQQEASPADFSDFKSEYSSRNEQRQTQEGLSPTDILSQADILAHAATLLVEIAGPEPAHVEMSPAGPQKYYSVKGAITQRDTRAHLKGWKTKGAYLRRPDGMTRALCYDADTLDDWEALLDAARLLAEAGYLPVVEDSPARNDKHIGGHLWLIYTRLVNAAAAQQHAVQVAPMLQHIKEFWPGPGGNRVRLPGGKYVKPGFAAWCKLHDAHGARIAEDGQNAARVLLTYQTPSELVPESPEPVAVTQRPGSESAHPMSQDVVQQAQACNAPNGTIRKTPGVDQHWHEKYGRFSWFQFTAAQLAAWFNERYDVTDIIEFDKDGRANASVIGRPERTPSLAYTKDRKRFTDFGASARRANGKPDSGDVLELRVRVNAAQDGMSKAETLRQVGQQLKDETRQALESAARSGEQPPQWVQAFLSPAGWEHYHQMLNEAGRAIPEPAPYTGGVAGFSPNDTDFVGRMHANQRQRQLRESAQDVPPETNYAHEIEAFAAEIVAEIGKPCHTCGCTLYYRNSVGESICQQCLPRPQKYAPGMLTDHQWERLRALFPRRG